MVFLLVYIKVYLADDWAKFYMLRSLFYMKFAMNLCHNVFAGMRVVDMADVSLLLYYMAYNHDD